MNSRSLGYIVSSLLGLLFYVAWIFCELLLLSRGDPEPIRERLSVLRWFALFGGVVFLALILPWTVAVNFVLKASGKLYFAFVGAIFVFVLGCLMSPLMPGPTFEDPTFIESVIFAVQRQGFGFALAGSVFGASYWFISERHARANKTLGSPSAG